MRTAKSRGEQRTPLVGSSQPMLEAVEKVRGRAVYVGDLDLPNMAHAKILRSPFPHARLISVDASAARAHPGVVCVLTRDEVLADPTMDSHYGYVFRDAPLVALDKVRHQGDIVAVVVAGDEVTAEEALELIDVEYEELPAVLDMVEAMAPGAPLIHDEMRPIAQGLRPVNGTNICHNATLQRGDIEQGFRESDYVFEDSYAVPPVQHCALELHCCIAQVTDSQITVWTNCQSPFPLQAELERIFKRPARVIVPYVGGGFGSKSRDRMEAVVVAAAKLAGRPVKLELTQEETFQTFNRPALTCHLKTGVKRDGSIVARHYKFITDSGAYAISGPRNANNTIKVAAGPYKIPHVLIECYTVYTNKPPSTPYRGLPTTQHTLAYETQMDRIARALDMDPVEIRMKNLLVEGDVHVTGDFLRSVHAKECLQRVSEAMGRQDQQAATGGKLRGKGLSCSIKYTITPPVAEVASEAEIALRQDGVFEVRLGTVNMGQGSDTALAQIAADALGVTLEQVHPVHSDTALVPPDHGTTASRSTYHMGNAVVDAAKKLKAQVLDIASQLMEEDSAKLELSSEGVFVPDNLDKHISLAHLVQRYGGAVSARGECVAGGTYTAPSGQEYPITSTFWTFASAGAEVEVSVDTGEVRVVRVATAANLGRAVNPKAAEAQLEGGVAMDLGPTLFERMVWDEGGQLLNASLMDYPLPTMDIMPKYHTETVEHPLEGAPFGAKGVGEIGAVIVPAAIVNAVYDATGILFHQLPLTPDVVLEALEKASQDAPAAANIQGDGGAESHGD